MTISAKDAIEIAELHSLSVHDALALRDLAEDVDDAKEIAQRFSRRSEEVQRTVDKIGRL